MSSDSDRCVAPGAEQRARPDELVLANKVEAMTGYGLTASDIACVLEIDEDALRADYGQQLRSGPIKANARVAESLYHKALGDDRQAVTAAIFWLKTRARWKETSVHEIADERKPIDLSTWSDEMLIAAIEDLQPTIDKFKKDSDGKSHCDATNSPSRATKE